MASKKGLDNPRFQIGLHDTLRIVWPYLRRNFFAQLQGVWFIVAYLLLFQLAVLGLPIVYSAMISMGIFIVIIGLMFFMEGLRLGLMPLGETIGRILPANSKMPGILLFAFILGVGATFAEPAISVLKAAGSSVNPQEAPLLAALLNQYTGQLVGAVGVGVGIAVILGIARFFYGWPLKTMAIGLVGLLLVLSVVCSQIDHLSHILGLAWDCGAVTTGPVTVPLVLALGIGVCRVVSSSKSSSGNSGFGIVTLASLMPIIAVLLLSIFHYISGEYMNFVPEQNSVAASEEKQVQQQRPKVPLSQEEYQAFAATGELPENHHLSFKGGDMTFEEGIITLNSPQVIISKAYDEGVRLFHSLAWDKQRQMSSEFGKSAMEALRAIIPLCLFLFIVLRVFLKQKLHQPLDMVIGIAFAFLGMLLFSLGISLGLTPLGGQLGSHIPITFAEIVPEGHQYLEGPIFDFTFGKLLTIFFGFFLGYGATLAEPALNALGETVERITVGAFRKRLLMQSVAIGVGFGIALGVTKMAFQIPLINLLVPLYLFVLVLTYKAPHTFVNFSWDSAGVTTGPITVPLVLAMGLGIGANIPGVSDGFGLLALASVGPIMTVLIVGLYTQAQNRPTQESSSPEAPGQTSEVKEAV